MTTDSTRGRMPAPSSSPNSRSGGDSVTLIERLTAHAELDSTRQMGSMETCSLLTEAANRLAVLGEEAILRAALAECEAVLYTLRHRAEIRNWDSTAMLSRQYVDGVIRKAQNALQDPEAAVLELRESERSKSLEDASASVAQPVETLRQIREAQAINAQLARELREHERQWFERYREQDAVIHELQSTLHRLLGATSQYRSQIIPGDDAEYELAHELDAAIAAASTTANSVGLLNPDPVESDRQSGGEKINRLVAEHHREFTRAQDLTVSLMEARARAAEIAHDLQGAIEDAMVLREEAASNDGLAAGLVNSLTRIRRNALASTTAALPPPKSGSSGLGSASALEVEADAPFGGEDYRDGGIRPSSVRESITAVKEHLGESAEEKAEWWQETAAFLADAAERLLDDRSLASATKPEASPSPENELQDAETGAAIRPRAEADDCDR